MEVDHDSQSVLRGHVAASVWFAVVLTLSGSYAFAAAEDARKVAREKTQQASAAYDLGQYEKAAALYEEAYAAVPEPALLYNIGQAYRKAEQYDKALISYRSYLRRVPEDDPLRAQVQERVAELEARKAEQSKTQVVEANVAPPSPPKPTASVVTNVPQPWTRQGRWGGGGGLVVGTLRATCTGCGDAMEAGGLYLRGGYLTRPKLMAVVDWWHMQYADSTLTVYQHMLVVGVSYWFIPRLWGMAGLGIAAAGLHGQGTLTAGEYTETGPGLVLSVGYDIYQIGRFIFDLELRYGTGFYGGNDGDGHAVEAHSAGIALGVSRF